MEGMGKGSVGGKVIGRERGLCGTPWCRMTTMVELVRMASGFDGVEALGVMVMTREGF